MTEHLPECPWFPNTHEDVSCNDSETLVSFCDALRACEQRVREEERNYRNEVEYKYQLAADEGCAAFNAALDAAQDAVAAISGHSTWPDMSYNDGLIDALDAIDALREGKT